MRDRPIVKAVEIARRIQNFAQCDVLERQSDSAGDLRTHQHVGSRAVDQPLKEGARRCFDDRHVEPGVFLRGRHCGGRGEQDNQGPAECRQHRSIERAHHGVASRMTEARRTDNE